MKTIKKILILFAFAFSFINANATPPTWSVNAVDFNYSMSYVGVVYLNFEKMADENSMIGAFVGDECRGVATPVYEEKNGSYTFYLSVYSNVDNQTITFKYYSSTTGEITTFDKTDTFIADGISGSPFDPQIWADPELDGADILSYEIDGQVRSEIVNYDINVVVPKGADITNAISTFEVSGGALVKIGEVIQVSKVTANDFSKPLIYTVSSADGSNENQYTVNIIIEDLTEAKTSSAVTPNGDGVNDVWIVQDVEKFAESTFYIMDAYGHKLFESVGYDNSWNGTYKGANLPRGNYYYIIKKPDGNALSGTISIIY